MADAGGAGVMDRGTKSIRWRVKGRTPVVHLASYAFCPPHVRCMTVAPEVQAELRAMARGRMLLIEYVVRHGMRGAAFGDVQARWVRDVTQLPDHVALLDDLDEPPTFVSTGLAPILTRVHAHLKVRGPRRLPWLRHPDLVIGEMGSWAELVLAGGLRHGRR